MGRRGHAAAAGVLALVAAFPAAASAGRVERLDRPGRRSYFAFVERPAPARARPSAAARRITRLTLRTPVGTDDLVLVLARTTDARGRAWLRVRLPIRPNNSTGWVRAGAVGVLQPLQTWLRINTRTFRATLVKARKTVFSAPIGVGQPQWPTPRGEFYIRAKLTGYGGRGSFYGPVSFVTSATSDVLTDWPGGGIVGVHGTSLPGLIPGRISHGCIRLRNSDIVRLAKLMPVGTPVSIT